MAPVINGKAWTMGDNIDTDQLAPSQSIGKSAEERLAVMLPLHRHIVDGLDKGDLVIGGHNFGCGSSREQAVENLVALGVSCVIGESFARIFLRNAIASALPALTCPGISAACDQDDHIEVNWTTFEVINHTKNTSLQAQPFTNDMKNIIEEGGMMTMLKKRFAS